MGDPQDLAKAARTALDSHGYGFHHSVLQQVVDLAEDQESPWLLEAAEFPVQVRGRATRIDLILRNEPSDFFLVCECKRPDPRLTRWCFFKAPYLFPANGSGRVMCDILGFSGDETSSLVSARGTPFIPSERIYDLAFVASNKSVRGAGQRNDRKAIEECLTQVCLGVNGLVDHLARVRAQSRQTQNLRLLGAVFTTASLYTSDLDLRTADIDTGRIVEGNLELSPQDWLFLHYPVSPGIKHSHSWTTTEPGAFKPFVGEGTHRSLYDALRLGQSLQDEFLRSIAIVSPVGISDFLKTAFG